MNAVDATRSFQQLSQIIGRHAGHSGTGDTAIPGVKLSCSAGPTALQFYFAKPAVYFVVQGQKQVICNGQTLIYGPCQYLLASIDMPVSGSIIEASPDKPCLGIHLALQPSELSALMLESNEPHARALPEGPALHVGKVSQPMLDALVRLAGLLDAPADISVMAPLVTREILFRLLQGDRGAHLAHIALAHGRVQKIAKAIKWLKENFAEPLRIAALARELNMSESNLYHQFKSITGVSPLQYQKALRLQEARRRLLAGISDVTRAGQSVGYENSSQFIREYSRQFGDPPLRDINRLKATLRMKDTREEIVADPFSSSDLVD
ncbi:AraC family transcriptional regulator [Paraburkholderia sp. J12]|uniref:AraC family transcriptional regulator n=1 Tax=Paraburkholderia sp. J12 TaxID=2805432 RepID=UPI002ABDA467|nr:AraC family transcriptional regulator [Paraburkholderia sp. J12]